MVFSILPANTESAAYEIDNSLRTGGGDNHHLSMVYSSAASDASRRTWTFSGWIKLGQAAHFTEHYDDEKYLLTSTDAAVSTTHIGYGGYTSGNAGGFFLGDGRSGTYIETTSKFRDPSAWYHLVIKYDSTQSTASDRIFIYVNGESQPLNYSNTGDPEVDLNTTVDFFLAGDNVDATSADSGNFVHNINSYYNSGFGAINNSFDGHFADWYLLDGQALAPTEFAETNDNGVWVPKKYTGTFNSHSFHLEFKQTGSSANSSGIGADTSGQDNHFKVGVNSTLAAVDITTDTPTNNFATMNPVHVSSHGSAALPTFSEGNLKIGMNSDSSTSSTIAPSKGKWYVEYKQSENTADNQGYPIVGISATLGGTGGDVIGFRTPDSTNYRGQLGTTSVNNAFGSARSANDIFGFYINLDDDILIVHKNGSDYMGSGASSGLDWSGGLTTTNEQTGFYHFYVQNNQDGSPAYTDEVNFGNPTFSISSSNSDANGYGSFEYSPTLSGTNYYALCTKNLAEFG